MKKSYRNIFLALYIHYAAFILDVCFLLYGNFQIAFLIPFSVILVIIVLSFILSLYTWNSAIYIDQSKFWTKKKGKKCEWRFEQITHCRLLPRWYGRPRAYKIEITSGANPKKLIFEYGAFREKTNLNMVKGTQAEKIFSDAFK